MPNARLDEAQAGIKIVGKNKKVNIKKKKTKDCWEKYQ